MNAEIKRSLLKWQVLFDGQMIRSYWTINAAHRACLDLERVALHVMKKYR
jgi:hypothetical protein